MSNITDGDILLSRGIQVINAMVETLSFEDAHYYIGLLRQHLDARYEQTRPLECPCEGACMNAMFGESFKGCRGLAGADDLSDLLGVQ